MLPNPRPYFEELSDPRRETKNKLHKLIDIVMIVLCSVLSGIEDWANMEVFAEEKEEWFRRFLELPNGIPSHDTLSDVIGRIDRKSFADCFLRWVKTGLPCLLEEHIALDGKALRGSRQDGESLVYLVSAYASKARLVLGQQAVEGKSNEITVIPKLLDMLDIEGAVITIDAMGCQKEIAKKIIEGKADYILALKGNHSQLHEDIKLWLDTEWKKGRLEIFETLEKDHGRIETRRYALSSQIDWLEQKKEWAGLKTVGVVESIREIGDKISIERRYYINSIEGLSKFSEMVRAHWSIENQQHWVLDVQFGEDNNRSRKDYSAENLAVIRRASLNMLRHSEDSKRSLRKRQLRAALNDDYRWATLMGAST
jgi:predicted transposase YbfD/YdcC